MSNSMWRIYFLVCIFFFFLFKPCIFVHIFNSKHLHVTCIYLRNCKFLYGELWAIILITFIHTHKKISSLWVCIINKESIKSFSSIKNNCIIKISAYGYTCNRKSVKIKGTEIFVFDILSHKNNYIWDIQKWIQNILVISNQNTHENGKFYLQGYLIFFFFSWMMSTILEKHWCFPAFSSVSDQHAELNLLS